MITRDTAIAGEIEVVSPTPNRHHRARARTEPSDPEKEWA